jgi:hypothetical protein
VKKANEIAARKKGTCLAQQCTFSAHVGACEQQEGGVLSSQLDVIGHKTALQDIRCRMAQRLGPQNLRKLPMTAWSPHNNNFYACDD